MTKPSKRPPRRVTIKSRIPCCGGGKPFPIICGPYVFNEEWIVMSRDVDRMYVAPDQIRRLAAYLVDAAERLEAK